MEKVKIVHIITGLETGGAELMLQRLILKHQPQERFEHCVISLTTLGVIGVELQNAGVRVDAINMTGFAAIFKIISQLRTLLKEHNPDLVQTWLYHADFLGGLASYSIGCKSIIWGVHSTQVSFWQYPLTAILRLVCALLSYILPSKIWYVARKSASYHEALGYDSKKSVVIHNGFDLDYWTAHQSATSNLKLELGLAQSDIVIGSVGRYNPDKDHTTLLTAFKLLLESKPNAYLVLVGKGLDDGNNTLTTTITELQIESKVYKLGPRSDVYKIFSGFDVFCLHSKTEAFPLVLGEAMASEVLCVTTDVGDASYLLGQTDLVVPKENPVQLAKVLNRALDFTLEHKDECRKSGRKRIEELFSIQAMLLQIEDLYLNILRKSK